MSRKIGCDLDGCLCNFTDAYSKLLTERTGKKFPNQSADWPTSWNWDTDAGISREDIKGVWEEIREGNTFWYRLSPMPGAIDTVKNLEKLTRAGHDVYFITNRMGAKAKFQTEQWLYNIGMNYPTVLMAADKLPIIEALGIDFYIDDKPETIFEIAKTSGCPSVRSLYMKDMAYNRAHTMLPFNRVSTVREALEKEGLWLLPN